MEEDFERTLGWAANVRQLALGENTDDGDLTAPESEGAGFARSGPDDFEDGHDAEGMTDDNGLGDADGWLEQQLRDELVAL